MTRRLKPFAQSSAPPTDELWMRGYRAGVVDAARDAGEMVDLPTPDLEADDEASEPDDLFDESVDDEEDE